MNTGRIVAPSAEAERMAILTEELGEVLQAIGKIQRHGWVAVRQSPASIHRYDNREQLETELGNLKAIINRMVINGDIRSDVIDAAAIEHHHKLKQYTYFQPDSIYPAPAPFEPVTKRAGFEDRHGRHVMEGDKVLWDGEQGVVYTVSDIAQDGDAFITDVRDPKVTHHVKWIQLEKAP